MTAAANRQTDILKGVRTTRCEYFMILALKVATAGKPGLVAVLGASKPT
jgi:hypothetical protein